ncbi:hypothetical protein FH972_016249 [Carpinus fangiana]|uniref:TF-B3 domain-containing protein n=1 Tax=Carpinus fangiana TaxID=176857 RepID=A0A5N6RFC2_9ROSI|nr:hypothetical protein FH972_016249 [Carpinus fangiana]
MANRSSIPEAILNMGFSDPVLVIQKPLSRVDLSPEHGRFSIPLRKIRDEFLAEEEKTALNNGDSIEVKMMVSLSPMPVSDLVLAKWETTSSYVLKCGWHAVVVRQKGLKVGEKVQLWSCRRPGRLWFLLIAVEAEEEE